MLFPHTPIQSPSDSRRTADGDRLIPSRSVSNLKVAFELARSPEIDHDEDFNLYESVLASELLPTPKQMTRPRRRTCAVNENSVQELLAQIASDADEPEEEKESQVFVKRRVRRRRKHLLNDPTHKDETPALNTDPRRVFRFMEGCTTTPTQENNVARSPTPHVTPFGKQTLELLSTPLSPPMKKHTHANKIIEAPDLKSDFYSHLLDWSDKNDTIIVGTGEELYGYHRESKTSSKLGDLNGISPEYAEEAEIVSVVFSPLGAHVAVGNSIGGVDIFDAERRCCVFHLMSSPRRDACSVGTLSWNHVGILAGSMHDSILEHLDLRAPSGGYSRMFVDSEGTLGLDWSFNDRNFAIGCRDQTVKIWDIRSHSERNLCQLAYHGSSVRAVAWSPHDHGILATGGGIFDKSLCLWDVRQTCLNSDLHGSDLSKPVLIQTTEGQICNLIWNPHQNQILSTNGFHTNDMILYNGETLRKVETWTGQNDRLIYCALSPNGRTVATAGDETIQFWTVFRGENENADNLWMCQPRFESTRHIR